MSKGAAIFPFCQPTQLPIVRHFNGMQSKYSLQQLISWKGTGLHGKDAAIVCNHPSIGLTVKDDVDLRKSVWDTIFVDFLETKNKYSTIDMAAFLQDCLEANKHIVLVSNTCDGVLGDVSDILMKYPENVSLVLGESSVKHDLVAGLAYSLLDIPVLLVGGLVERNDALEVIVALRELFVRDGISVSCFTGSNLGLLLGMHSYNFIFDNKALTESEKILMLNQVARDIIRSERPELLIVEAPDAVLKYSDIAPNGFGIRTYMANLAFNPQMFVCCMPYNFISQGFVEKINQGIADRYGFSISAINVSNVLMDYLAIMQEQSVSYVHTDLEYMHQFLKGHVFQSSIPLYDVIYDGATEMYRYICGLLE